MDLDTSFFKNLISKVPKTDTVIFYDTLYFKSFMSIVFRREKKSLLNLTYKVRLTDISLILIPDLYFSLLCYCAIWYGNRHKVISVQSKYDSYYFSASFEVVM